MTNTLEFLAVTKTTRAEVKINDTRKINFEFNHEEGSKPERIDFGVTAIVPAVNIDTPNMNMMTAEYIIQGNYNVPTKTVFLNRPFEVNDDTFNLLKEITKNCELIVSKTQPQTKTTK